MNSNPSLFTGALPFVAALFLSTLGACSGGDSPPGPGSSTADAAAPAHDASPSGFVSADAAPGCQGIATPCELLPVNHCSTAVGCTYEGTCSGAATACAAVPAASCSLQQGCSLVNGQTCSGIADDCSSNYIQVSCSDTRGCTWTPGCTGFVLPCSALNEEGCIGTTGCTWK